MGRQICIYFKHLVSISNCMQNDFVSLHIHWVYTGMSVLQPPQLLTCLNLCNWRLKNRALLTVLMYISCRISSDELFNVFCHLLHWPAELITLERRAAVSKSRGPQPAAAQGMRRLLCDSHTWSDSQVIPQGVILSGKTIRERFNRTFLLAGSSLPAPMTQDTQVYLGDSRNFGTDSHCHHLH